MTYQRDIRVEFNHCDPAGIMFYPRYFEMVNSVVENFFRDIAKFPFEAMMAEREGVPTASIEATFHAPTRLGEILDWRLTVVRLGRTSTALHLEAHSGGTHRITADLTLVYISSAGRPKPWPDDVRTRFNDFREST
jgi:4-hydroxybenzoyl-CoA thioesterase